MVIAAGSWSLRQDPTFFKQALKNATQSLVVYYRKTAQNLPTKPVIIVPKHTVKSAVSRHAIKRQLRAIIRLNAKQLPYQWVVVVQRSALNQTYQGLEAQFQAVLEKTPQHV